MRRAAFRPPGQAPRAFRQGHPGAAPAGVLPGRCRGALITRFMQTAADITGYGKHWAERFGTAPFLPMSRAEMELLGWDSCDVVIVTGDAYVDHPSFGMAIVGRG